MVPLPQSHDCTLLKSKHSDILPPHLLAFTHPHIFIQHILTLSHPHILTLTPYTLTPSHPHSHTSSHSHTLTHILTLTPSHPSSQPLLPPKWTTCYVKQQQCWTHSQNVLPGWYRLSTSWQELSSFQVKTSPNFYSPQFLHHSLLIFPPSPSPLPLHPPPHTRRTSWVSASLTAAVHQPWQQLCRGPPVDGTSVPASGPREAVFQLPWTGTQQKLWGMSAWETLLVEVLIK